MRLDSGPRGLRYYLSQFSLSVSLSPSRSRVSCGALERGGCRTRSRRRGWRVAEPWAERRLWGERAGGRPAGRGNRNAERARTERKPERTEARTERAALRRHVRRIWLQTTMDRTAQPYRYIGVGTHDYHDATVTTLHSPHTLARLSSLDLIPLVPPAEWCQPERGPLQTYVGTRGLLQAGPSAPLLLPRVQYAGS